MSSLHRVFIESSSSLRVFIESSSLHRVFIESSSSLHRVFIESSSSLRVFIESSSSLHGFGGATLKNCYFLQKKKPDCLYTFLALSIKAELTNQLLLLSFVVFNVTLVLLTV
ncbi:uncharacterized protein V6R79_016205 [Siganus canaliculatus]